MGNICLTTVSVCSDCYELLCPHLTSDSDATGHKQMHSTRSWSWASGWGSDRLQEGFGEMRTPAPCLWWGCLVEHCPELPPPPVRLGSFEVFLLPLALEVRGPQPFQASCLSTLTLEWLQPVLRLSKELLRFLPHHPQTSCPPFHSILETSSHPTSRSRLAQ